MPKHLSFLKNDTLSSHWDKCTETATYKLRTVPLVTTISTVFSISRYGTSGSILWTVTSKCVCKHSVSETISSWTQRSAHENRFKFFSTALSAEESLLNHPTLSKCFQKNTKIIACHEINFYYTHLCLNDTSSPPLKRPLWLFCVALNAVLGIFGLSYCLQLPQFLIMDCLQIWLIENATSYGGY